MMANGGVPGKASSGGGAFLRQIEWTRKRGWSLSFIKLKFNQLRYILPMIPRIGLCLLCLGHIKLIWPFLSDDVKKEAAKMMKKINEVAERSENLESQVIVWSGDQLLSVKCSGDDVHVWTWRFTWPQPVNAHTSYLLQLLSWSSFAQNWVVINVIKWENKSLRIVFCSFNPFCCSAAREGIGERKWILFGKRIFEQKEGWERISAEVKHAHQERLRECWATIEAGGKY